MGGRGTFAAGNNAAFMYETLGFIDGVKVLRGLPGFKGLPVEAHSSTAYIQLHPDGKFKMYREFDSNHYLVKEIAYHREPKLSGNNKPVLHIHEYEHDNFDNRTPRLLTKKEYENTKNILWG